MQAREGDPDYMLSLARGLAVLETLAAAHEPLTIAEVARATGLNRAAARRALHTLETLGYAAADGGGFAVTMKPVALSRNLVAPSALARRAQPLLDRLRDGLGESCSLGVVEDDQLQYVARAEAYRIMAVGLRVGSRLPLYATSMGRVLLAGMGEDKLHAYLGRTPVQALTGKTITDRAQLRAIIRQAGVDGFAIVDQELEIGLRSVAVPVTRAGATVAALNVGTSTARVTLAQIRSTIIPALRATAAALGALG